MSRTVDIIVPCYNYGSYLSGCIQSLLEQPGVVVRALIIDDCSSDNSAEVGLALARRDNRVTFRRHAQNHGHIATYNEGFAWATADYVLLISADDLLTAGALTRAVDILESHPDVAFAYGRQVSFSESPALPDEPVSRLIGHEVIDGIEFIRRVCSSADNPVATPTVVVRTARQHQAGDYTPSLPHTADLEMWLRLAAIGSVARLDAYQAFKRMHKTNMQHAYVSGATGDLIERQSAFTLFLDRAAEQLPDTVALRAASAGTLARHAVWRGAELFDLGRAQEAMDLLALATQFDAGVRNRREWVTLAIKTQMGSRFWRLVQPAAGWVRRCLQAARPVASSIGAGR